MTRLLMPALASLLFQCCKALPSTLSTVSISTISTPQETTPDLLAIYKLLNPDINETSTSSNLSVPFNPQYQGKLDIEGGHALTTPIPAGWLIHNLISTITDLWRRPTDDPMTQPLPYEYRAPEQQRIFTRVIARGKAKNLTPKKACWGLDRAIGAALLGNQWHWLEFFVLEKGKQIAKLETGIDRAGTLFNTTDLVGGPDITLSSRDPDLGGYGYGGRGGDGGLGAGEITVRPIFSGVPLNRNVAILIYRILFWHIWSQPARNAVPFKEGKGFILEIRDKKVLWDVEMKADRPSSNPFRWEDLAYAASRLVVASAAMDKWELVRGEVRRDGELIALMSTSAYQPEDEDGEGGAVVTA